VDFTHYIDLIVGIIIIDITHCWQR